MLFNVKHCVQEYLLIYSEEISDLYAVAKWFIVYTQNFELGVPVRNYRSEYYFQATF